MITVSLLFSLLVLLFASTSSGQLNCPPLPPHTPPTNVTDLRVNVCYFVVTIIAVNTQVKWNVHNKTLHKHLKQKFRI